MKCSSVSQSVPETGVVINSSYCLEVVSLVKVLVFCHLRVLCFCFYLLLLPFGE